MNLAKRTDVNGAAPFLKWAGGKQRLILQYQPYFPPICKRCRYFEPFIGSGAVFFHLRPPLATLSDRNPRLIEVYRAIQNDVEGVIRHLKSHCNTPDHFYRVRAQNPIGLSLAERAARLIYLNRTCYNGLYRENRKGQFNVPFGRYHNPTICNELKLRSAAAALQGVILDVADFQEIASRAKSGDFIYFDPPYVPLTPSSSFTQYHRHGFDEEDHRRLADTIHQLTNRDCRVMLSNSSAPLVYELYEGRGYHLIPVQARRNINSKGNRRGPVTELLILNYTLT